MNAEQLARILRAGERAFYTSSWPEQSSAGALLRAMAEEAEAIAAEERARNTEIARMIQDKS